MELTAGYPFWLIKDGLPFNYPELTEDCSCDVLVIGGGISGALTAYRLTQAGFSCLLVDSRTIGLGSTCASTALLQYELDIPLSRLEKKIGKAKAQRAYQVCGESIDQLFDIFNHTGFSTAARAQSLFFSNYRNEQKMLQRELVARRETGFAISWLNGDDLLQQYGLEAKFGLLSEKGATLDAYAFTHHLLQQAMKAGLRVADRSGIEKLTEEKAGVVAKTYRGPVIRSTFAVNATGYEVVNFIGKKIVNFDCTYAFASEQDYRGKKFDRDTIFWNTDDPYLYLRTTTDGRLIAGGRDEPFSTKTTRENFLARKTAQLEKDVRKQFPDLDFNLEFSWSGTFGTTKDALPFIGPRKKGSRIYYALGFGGNGITFSQAAAVIITDQLQGKPNADGDLFSFDR